MVSNPELKTKLKDAAYGQNQLIEADQILIICPLKNLDEKIVEDYIKNINETRQTPLEELQKHKEMMLGQIAKLNPQQAEAWTAQQAYIVLGFIMAACAMAEIDACPMEGFEPEKVDEILNLTNKNLTAKIICPLGFRSDSDVYSKMKKVRLNQSELFIKLI